MKLPKSSTTKPIPTVANRNAANVLKPSPQKPASGDRRHAPRLRPATR